MPKPSRKTPEEIADLLAGLQDALAQVSEDISQNTVATVETAKKQDRDFETMQNLITEIRMERESRDRERVSREKYTEMLQSCVQQFVGIRVNAENMNIEEKRASGQHHRKKDDENWKLLREFLSKYGSWIGFIGMSVIAGALGIKLYMP